LTYCLKNKNLRDPHLINKTNKVSGLNYTCHPNFFTWTAKAHATSGKNISYIYVRLWIIYFFKFTYPWVCVLLMYIDFRKIKYPIWTKQIYLGKSYTHTTLIHKWMNRGVVPKLWFLKCLLQIKQLFPWMFVSYLWKFTNKSSCWHKWVIWTCSILGSLWWVFFFWWGGGPIKEGPSPKEKKNLLDIPQTN
jgi:hypothetical protein